MEILVGHTPWTVELPPQKAIAIHFPPGEASKQSPREQVLQALESPFEFEPLRRALTPDDRIAIVLDAELPHVAELLGGVLEHLASAGIAPAAVTVITSPGSRQDWIDDLPDEYADVIAETHEPSDRNKLAYLATTQSGRRVYMNRSLVQADFMIALTGRRFDPVRGIAGAELALYPDLADDEIRSAHFGPFPKKEPWNGLEESREVAWLLGTPFFVQVIEGAGDAIGKIVAGLIPSSDEGRRCQEEAWKWGLDSRVDTAIATISGDPNRITFLDLAKAAKCAAKAVKKGGRIALLTEAAPELGPAGEILRQLDEPKSPESWLAREKPADWAACRLWCSAAAHASIFLASGYPDELAEELFATPLHGSSEAQRLVDAAASVVLIPDAHRVRVEIAHL